MSKTTDVDPAPVESMGITLYGLTANGMSWLDGIPTDWNCRLMFRNRDDAIAEIPAFIERVCEPSDDNLDCLRRETVTVEVFEYELSFDRAGMTEKRR